MQISGTSQVHAAALYVSLVRDQAFNTADSFLRWWWAETGFALETAGYAGVSPEWDADELGIDEEDQWP